MQAKIQPKSIWKVCSAISTHVRSIINLITICLIDWYLPAACRLCFFDRARIFSLAHHCFHQHKPEAARPILVFIWISCMMHDEDFDFEFMNKIIIGSLIHANSPCVHPSVGCGPPSDFVQIWYADRSWCWMRYEKPDIFSFLLLTVFVQRYFEI